MLAAYTFNTQYQPLDSSAMPQLRLLEGGRFMGGDYAPILLQEEHSVRLKYFRWGLITDVMQVRPEREARLFVTAEQALRQPTYLSLLRRQRCLVPSDGFYTEGTLDRGARAFKLSQSNGKAFCLAGLYEVHRQPNGQLLHSFAMLTRPSPMRMSRCGERLPVILPKNVETAWLNPYTDLNKIQKLLQLPSGTGLSVHPVQELSLPTAAQIDPVAA